MDGELQGKVCIITGANSGIGLETALGLARKGAILGLICRDPVRSSAAVEHIRRETGNTRVSLHLADLRSQQQVRLAAKSCLESYPEIHVLINNAGLVARERAMTEDGLETVWAVNYLSCFMLTRLMLERLKASAPARIINMASEAYMMGRLDFTDIDSAYGRYRSFQAYGNAKLAVILFTRELARRLEGTKVTANCLHPGIIASRFGSNLRLAQKSVAIIMLPWVRSPRTGAATSIYLACSPEVEGVTGKYFKRCKPSRIARKARDDAQAARLWQLSERLIGSGAVAR